MPLDLDHTLLPSLLSQQPELWPRLDVCWVWVTQPQRSFYNIIINASDPFGGFRHTRSAKSTNLTLTAKLPLSTASFAA